MGGGKKEQKRAKQKALLLEKKAQKDSVQDLVNKVKKAEKASKDGQDVSEDTSSTPAASCPPCSSKQVTAEAPGADAQHCAVCGEVFPSRSKLFKHIEATGHAALKSAPGPEPVSKGKKKKR